MADVISAAEISEEVNKALEATLKLESYPERLWPYTQAELNFLKDFVSRAIINVMDRARK